MDYIKTTLKEIFSIKKIITIHYFEFAKDFIFEGEEHNFWELVYVDKGEVEIMADTQGYKLRQGEIIFHKPNEFHSLWANGKVAPNLIVIAFECHNPLINFFENKILTIENLENKLLAQIIRESKEAFSSPLNKSSLKKMEKRKDSFVGCEQLIKIHLEHLLISLRRKESSVQTQSRLSKVAKERSDNNMIQRITKYMKENISKKIKLDDIAKFSRMSKTNLKRLFKQNKNVGVIEYYNILKIEEAKKLLRESELNITQISKKLGYTSIHYFSRSFKKMTGMSPSEYSRSAKIRI